MLFFVSSFMFFLILDSLPLFLFDLSSILLLPKCFLHLLFSLGPLDLLHVTIRCSLLEVSCSLFSCLYVFFLLISSREVGVLLNCLLIIHFFSKSLFSFLLVFLDPQLLGKCWLYLSQTEFLIFLLSLYNLGFVNGSLDLLSIVLKISDLFLHFDSLFLIESYFEL